MLRTVKILALVAMFFVALTASAQVTTSALSGVVTDENQQAMIGATITALHTPSGTKYNAVTNIDGRYTIQGMRPGGPYTVSVSYVGYETHEVKGVTLQLAETSNLDFDMSVDANALGEVVRCCHQHQQHPDHQPAHGIPQLDRHYPSVALRR